MTDHSWANLILRGAKEQGAMEIITAVNAIAAAGRANRGSVVVACAQLMAQTIAQSGPDVAPEIRQGIMTLIDDYALRLAMEGHP